MHSTCILTGVAFCHPTQDHWIWGDLHQLGNILIVNANGNEWMFEPVPEERRMVMAPLFYEKNCQIVFPLDIARFNKVARDYLGESLGFDKRIVTIQ